MSDPIITEYTPPYSEGMTNGSTIVVVLLDVDWLVKQWEGGL